jgi:AcrR family transcriptional regulator
LRQARKEATRRRVLDAARDLFEEIGYEATTIRAVASRAGVAVGSVFTGFSSKAHMLGEVMQDRLSDLYEEMERLLPHLRGSGADRCRSLFAAHYAFEMRRARLFAAFIGAAYDWPVDEGAPVFGTNAHLRGMVRQCLEGGIAHGDVAPQADLEMAVDMLLAMYSWNYRLVSLQDADGALLTALMDQQIGVIFQGLRP